MDVEAGMTGQLPLHLRVFVGGIVVGDQVNLLPGRCYGIDHPQKAKPPLMAMPVIAHGDDAAVQGVESRKQGRRAVALVIVRHRSAAALLQGQAGLGAIQSLNLALFVGAEYNCVLRRIQIQPPSPADRHIKESLLLLMKKVLPCWRAAIGL